MRAGGNGGGWLVGREVIAKTYMILFVVMKISAWLPKPFDYFIESKRS